MRAGTGASRASARSRMSAALLIAPLFAFMVVTFALPIGLALLRTFEDRAVSAALPRTAALLANWEGSGLPDPRIAATLLSELRQARGSEKLSVAASRLNVEISGYRSLFLRTARMATGDDGPDALRVLSAIDPRWGEHVYWDAMRNAVGPLSLRSVLAAVDLRIVDGRIVDVPEDQAVFRTVLARTFWVAFVVTLCCLVLGYPVAYLLAHVSGGLANWLMLLVLIPFWTSLLVRTVAWGVLLQDNGLINDALQAVRVIEAPIALIYNRTGVYIALVHVLLPLMILPLYSVMKGVPAGIMRAAKSLGATPTTALLRVYIPQTKAGIAAGCLLVFTSALGFYITPALVGGSSDQMLSYFVSFYTNETADWSLAGALSMILLLATALVCALFLAMQRGGAPKPAGR